MMNMFLEVELFQKCFKERNNEMKIRVKVKTKQQESKILQTGDSEYVVFVKSLPDRNKANEEVISLLAKHFSVNKAEIQIKTGKTSSKKTILIKEE